MNVRFLVILTNEFVRLPLLAAVRPIDFPFSVYFFHQGPICDDFNYSLVPVLQSIITFYSLVQIQQNQRSLLPYDLLYPDKQLKHGFENFKI